MTARIIKSLSIAIAAALVLFLLIQLIPYGKDHANPPVVSEPNWDRQQTRDQAQRACFDCHSNQTIWPWYSTVAPVSWLVFSDVVEGRRRMNFSDWQRFRLQEPGEISSVLSEGEMPPIQYLLMHPTARLSATEKSQLITGFQITMGQLAEIIDA